MKKTMENKVNNIKGVYDILITMRDRDSEMFELNFFQRFSEEQISL